MATLKQVKNFFTKKGQQNAYARVQDAVGPGFAINNPRSWDDAIKNYFTPQSAYAAESTPANGGSDLRGNIFSFQPKADGGWDFFINGQAASLQDYVNAGGQLPADATGVSTNPQNQVSSAYSQPATQQTTQPTSTQTSGGTGGGTGDGVVSSENAFAPAQKSDNQQVQPQPVTLNYFGELRNYDLSIQADRDRYYNDRVAVLAADRDAQIKELEDGFNTQGKEWLAQKESSIAAIEQDINDTLAEAKRYVTDYNRRVNEFGENKNLGDTRRQQYFAGLGANAFQSSASSSQKFANEKYLQGLGDMVNEVNQNVGTGFVGNQDVSNLDAGSVYGRRIGDFKGEISDVGASYNRFLDSNTAALNKGKEQITNAFDTAVAGEATELGQVDVAQNVDPFRYSRIERPAPQTSTANLNAFTPFTTFQSAAGTITPTQTTKPIVSNAFKYETPLDQALGRNPITPEQKDYLRKYLLGTA